MSLILFLSLAPPVTNDALIGIALQVETCREKIISLELSKPEVKMSSDRPTESPPPPPTRVSSPPAESPPLPPSNTPKSKIPRPSNLSLSELPESEEDAEEGESSSTAAETPTTPQAAGASKRKRSKKKSKGKGKQH